MKRFFRCELTAITRLPRTRTSPHRTRRSAHHEMIIAIALSSSTTSVVAKPNVRASRHAPARAAVATRASVRVTPIDKSKGCVGDWCEELWKDDGCVGDWCEESFVRSKNDGCVGDWCEESFVRSKKDGCVGDWCEEQ